MAINVTARIANLRKKYGISDVEAEAVVDKSLREGKKEGQALLGRIKRKEVQIWQVSYRQKEPETPEEKQEQQIRLNRAYDRLFDAVLRKRRKKPSS